MFYKNLYILSSQQTYEERTIIIMHIFRNIETEAQRNDIFSHGHIDSKWQSLGSIQANCIILKFRVSITVICNTPS